jgi:hypothetical protein
MTGAMQQQGVDPGIGRQHFEGMTRRGIPLEDALHILTDSVEH